MSQYDDPHGSPEHGPHLSVDELADLDEGLLAADAAAAARHHLDDCPACAATRGRPGRPAPATWPPTTPGPMPDDVLARLEAAVRAAARRARTRRPGRATEPRTAAHDPRPP